MKCSLLRACVSLLLAANYFCFQVEIFEEEYEENHRPISTVCSIAAPTLNWESFDKENAQKAFVVDACLRIEFLFSVAPELFQFSPHRVPYQPVRDKSPPAA